MAMTTVPLVKDRTIHLHFHMAPKGSAKFILNKTTIIIVVIEPLCLLMLPPSPNSWYPQAVNNGHPGGFSDAGPGISGVATSNSQRFQFSGAEVYVYDPQPGATEGRVVLSGTPAQLHAAQSLVRAFILCGQSF